MRLCALGTLGNSPMSYADLVTSIRHFIDRVQGPSVDVLGASIELLKFEGLVSNYNLNENDEGLTLTKKGERELKKLLTADIRPNDSNYNKLIEALKFRFLHLLKHSDRCIQAEILLERVELEIVRLRDLRDYHKNEDGYLFLWLNRDVKELENRVKWLKKFKNSL